QLPNFIDAPQIGLDRDRLLPHLFDLPNNFRRFLGRIAVVHRNVHSLFRQAQRHGTPQPLPRTGHQRNLIFEPSRHVANKLAQSANRSSCPNTDPSHRPQLTLTISKLHRSQPCPSTFSPSPLIPTTSNLPAVAHYSDPHNKATRPASSTSLPVKWGHAALPKRGPKKPPSPQKSSRSAIVARLAFPTPTCKPAARTNSPSRKQSATFGHTR